MQDDITVPGLLQGALEGFDQMMRELSDKTDGIRQHDLLSALQLQIAGGGIQGREQLILCQNARIRQAV